MLYRLFNPLSDDYVAATDSLEYLVHPTGAPMVNGEEDITLLVERSSELFDLKGREVFQGDIVSNKYGAYDVRFKNGAFIACNGSDRESLVNVLKAGALITGTIHDTSVHD
ncbi:MAG TPA: hypothetical protein VFL85_01615 [Candidatus Saccharimonadales bacterium]|nr:hypothetical protein [Candidatus Saccharimonadales bacterium]